MKTDQTKPTHKRSPNPNVSASSGGAKTIVFGFLLLLSLGVLAWWAVRNLRSDKRADSTVAVIGTAPRVAAQTEQQLRQRRQAFFEAEILAKLDATDESNRMAAKRCVQRLEQNFAGYRAGIDDFVQDITGMGSRFGILKRMPGGWWSGDDRVSSFITEKFATHLFTEKTLTEDLRTAWEGFREDVRANQRDLLTRTQAAISHSDLPPIKIDDYETFFAAVNDQISALADDEAKTSVTEGLVTLVVSEAGSTAVGMIAGRVIAGLTASSATAVAASGGATAGGAAAGAAGGSIVPGPGTVAGFVVGLGVGLVIDYWMNKKTAAALEAQLRQYIDQMESELIRGAVESDTSQPGIQAGMDTACERLRNGVHKRLFEIIVLEPSS